MADLKPIGSEKLQGTDKLRRIMEIATYNEVPKTEVNNLSTTNYSIQLPDGYTYGIVKEKQGYIIKKGINESDMNYSDPMKNRKYYRSYSEAMKKLNLIVVETNRITGNDFEIPLIGEQPEAKKKFVLKSTKKTEPEMSTPDVEPAPAPAPEPAPPMDMTEPPALPPTDDTTPSADTSDTEMSAEPMGTEPTGVEPTDNEPMDSETMDTEIEDAEVGTEEEGPSSLKLIQKLTGKLSQRLRMFDKDKGMDSQDIKYVINSIVSAINLSKLDDDDREEIVDKIEGFDDYGKEGEGELDFGVEDEFDFNSEEPEGDTELGGDTQVGGSADFEDTEMEIEPETKEGYQTVMDSIFGESQVEKVLSKYFQVKEKESPILENKNKLDFLRSKINKITQKEEVQRLSINETQKQVGLTLIEQYSNASFIGITTKKNLVFKINNREVKVTPQGKTI